MPVVVVAGQTINLGTLYLTPTAPPTPPPPPPPTTGAICGTIANAEAVGKYVYIDGFQSTNPIASNGYFIVENLLPGLYYTLTVEGFEPYSL